MAVALCLHNVRVQFGDRVVLDGVSLEVGRGEVVGLVGPNGSGKSTTLAVAAGVLDPASGTVAVEGQGRAKDAAAFASRVGLVPQTCALYDELTCLENLDFFGRLYGIRGRELDRRVMRALSRVGLSDRATERVGTLSGGLKQRANMAAALLHDPPVILLDEPTASLDAASRNQILADLSRLRDDGHAILMSTHHLDDVEAACDRIAILDSGRVAAIGEPAEVLRPAGLGRAILYAHLVRRPPRFVERAIRQRLGPGVELEITGRRLRLAAATSEDLGRALALVLAEGIEAENFRTPPTAMDRLLTPPLEASSGAAA